MDELLRNYLLAMTILPAAITGLGKWYSMDKTNRPIVLVWCLIAVSETIRYICIKSGIYTLMGYNLFLLVFLWLYLFQFRQWGLFLLRSKLWIVIGMAMTTLWLLEYVLLPGSSIHKPSPFYRMCQSLMLVLMAGTQINRLIVSEKKSIVRNPQFLICAGLVTYYTFRVLVDAFGLQGMSNEFLNRMANFNRYLVQVMYFLFFLAAIWIPKKKSFILQSS